MAWVFNPFTGTFDFTNTGGGGGGSPGGSSGQVQYNNGGSFGGLDLYYSSATLRLGAADVASGAAAQTLQVQSNTGAATTGPNFTIKGSSGTTAGGSIIFQTHNGTAYSTTLSVTPTSNRTVFTATDGGSGYIQPLANSLGLGTGVIIDTNLLVSSNFGIQVPQAGIIGWGTFGSAPDVRLYRDNSNTLALRNGLIAQTFNVYNTYTSAADYERGSFKWSSNVLTIASEKAGSGIARAMSFVDGGGTERINIAATSGVVLVADMQLVTSSSIGYIGAASSGFTLRYSSGANSDMMVRFTGITSSFPALKRSVTGVPLQVRLADDSGDAAFQCGTATSGGTAFNVNGTGGNSIASVTNTTTGTLLQVLNSTSNPLMTVTDTTSGTLFSVQSTTAATLFSVNDTTSGTLLAVTNSSSNDVFSVADGGAITGYDDTSANVLAIRNGTSLQTLRVYGTYTSSTNYERLFAGYVSAASAFRIGTEKGVGGGTARPLELQTDGTTRLTIAAAGLITSSQIFMFDRAGASAIGDPFLRVSSDATYAANRFYGIGFGYATSTGKLPVEIGFDETSSTGQTKGDFYIATRSVTTDTAPTIRLRITDAGKAEFSDTIKTAAPTSGTAAEWKLGTVATVSPTSPNRTIEVEIGGTTYYLHAKTTND